MIANIGCLNIRDYIGCLNTHRVHVIANIGCLNIRDYIGCLNTHRVHVIANIGCLNIRDYIGCLNTNGTCVTAYNSSNNYDVFFFVSDLKIVYYSNC